MSVLVVEDDEVGRRSLVRWLRRTDHEVIECATLADARCVDQSLAGAIVDVGLPDGDGLDLVTALRARDAQIEVLVMTGSSSARIVNRAHVLGASIARKPWLEANLREFSQRLGSARLPVGAPSLHASVDRLAARLGLTPQQQRILALRAGGVRRADLADELQVSESTVRSHVRAIVTAAGVAQLDHVAWMLLELVLEERHRS